MLNPENRKFTATVTPPRDRFLTISASLKSVAFHAGVFTPRGVVFRQEIRPTSLKTLAWVAHEYSCLSSPPRTFRYCLGGYEVGSHGSFMFLHLKNRRFMGVGSTMADSFTY